MAPFKIYFESGHAVTVRRCYHCDAHIQWLMTRYGKKLPFDYLPVAYDPETTDDAWIPGIWLVRGRSVTAMAPLSHYGHSRQERVRRVVVIHTCPGSRHLVDQFPEVDHGREVH